MAAVAIRCRMRSAQCEMGITCVIERGFFPAAFVVALLTFIAVSTAVHIIEAVAGHAGFRRIFIALAGVTGCTIDLLVTTLQRELGFIVIESRLFPGRRVMAGRTFLAECTAVAIILAVTAETFAFCLAKFLALLVTTVAGDIRVLAFELEIGSGVIERVAVETEDIGVAALVIGVALLAGNSGLMLQLAMETAFIGDIGRDHIMAIGTELILRLLGK